METDNEGERNREGEMMDADVEDIYTFLTQVGEEPARGVCIGCANVQETGGQHNPR